MDEKRVPDVSVCILNHNGRSILQRCLESLARHTCQLPIEIIVFDNGSTDDSCAMVRARWPHAILMTNPQNGFFTKAYNRMAEQSTGRYLLVLNNDVQFLDDSLTQMISLLDGDPNLAAIVPRSIKPDGSLELTCTREVTFCGLLLEWTILGWLLFRARRRVAISRRYDLMVQQDVEVAQDSCLLIRRNEIRPLYDERFRLYYTEDDLCKRLRAGGRRILYYPGAAVRHEHNYTSKRLNPIIIKVKYATDMLKYSDKYLGSLRTWLALAPLLCVTLSLRFTWQAVRAALGPRLR